MQRGLSRVEGCGIIKPAMRGFTPGRFAVLLAALPVIAYSRPAVFHHKHPASETSQVRVQAGKPGCSVDVDSSAQGKTGIDGSLTVRDVAPSEHYVHVDCPGQPELTYFVDPQPGATAQIQTQGTSSGGGEATPLGEAENNTELRRLVSVAANDREDGQFPEAVQTLRQAMELDPDNPGLHHELGMTFLMVHKWNEAAIELQEATHLDPASAGAHNALGYALEKLGKLQPAVDQFRTATQLDPSDGSYRDHYEEAMGMLAAAQSGGKKKHRRL